MTSVLGVATESLFYSFLDVNYLEYVSILDALLTQISLLINNKILVGVLMLFVLVVILGFIKGPKFIEKYKHTRWYEKLKKKEENRKGMQLKGKHGVIVIILYFLFSLLFGFRLGAGLKYEKKLAKGVLEIDYLLVFSDNSQLRIKKIGINSNYIFYVEENERTVTVTPIAENIKQIKKLPKEK